MKLAVKFASQGKIIKEETTQDLTDCKSKLLLTQSKGRNELVAK